MSKTKLHEFAKALDVPNKKIISKLSEFEIRKNYLSTMNFKELDIVLESLTQENEKLNKEDMKKTQQEIHENPKKTTASEETKQARRPKQANETSQNSAYHERKHEPYKKNNTSNNNTQSQNTDTRPKETSRPDNRKSNNTQNQGSFKPNQNKPQSTGRPAAPKQPPKPNNKWNNNSQHPKKNSTPTEETVKTSNPQNDDRSVVDGTLVNKKYYDTRPNTFDLSRLDTEKVEELAASMKVKEGPTKQKLKKSKPGERIQKVHTRVHKVVNKVTEVSIPDNITVLELAEKLGRNVSEIIKKLMVLGIMANQNQSIDFDTASLICEDLNCVVKKEIILTEEEILFNDLEDTEEQLKPRSPVVVVMGHVDHGKTSLLDAIRKTNVISTEAGGITQHIGAYRVRLGDKKMTFLDTPGHEAFTSMRARGAQITDVAILVVAADDGIMPQTVEAIDHAKAANIPIIVAINKIDKEGANPDKVKQQLTEHGLLLEEWGGDVIAAEISAKNRVGLEHLLEMVILVSDMRELKANPDRHAKGTVIESRLDKGLGPVATILVQNGTLKAGDVIVAGLAVGKIRKMVDDRGAVKKKAGPSMPVLVSGLSDVPAAGELFYVVNDEKKARDIVEKRKFAQKQESFGVRKQVTLDDLFSQIKQGTMKDLNIIIKADVHGSVEALRQSLEKITNDEVRVKIIHAGTGAINESDVMLAAASNAIIIGFNVRPDPNAKNSADLQGVDLRLYNVIYTAIEEVQSALRGMLAPKYKEVVLGHAEIREIYKISSIGTIAGCHVQNGKITRNCKIRLVRDGIVVHEGEIDSLKRFKDDAKEVMSGYDCGIGILNYNDIKQNDVIEGFIMEEIKQ